MPKTTKLFAIGSSQPVRLPAEFRCDTAHARVRRDEVNR